MMKGREITMSNKGHDDRFRALCARIENEVSFPSIVLVSSAGDADGSSLTAYGVVRTFAQSQYRCALLDANIWAPPPDFAVDVNLQRIEPRDLGVAATPLESGVDYLSFAGEIATATISKRNVRVATSMLRNAYDVVVVDSSRLLDNSVALLLASVADGILLSLCFGRPEVDADRRIMAAVDRLDARVLGIVTTDAREVRRFRRRAELKPTTRREAWSRFVPPAEPRIIRSSMAAT